MNNSKYVWMALVVVALIAIGGFYFPQVQELVGGGSRFPNGISADSTSPSAGQVRGTTFTSTGLATLESLNVNSGTTISELNAGTCYIRPYAATIAATTSALVDCQGTAAWNATDVAAPSALTGIAYGDWVVTNLASTTSAVTGGIVVSGVSASSTPGYIQLRLTNLTGTTFTWPVGGTASGSASYISGN